MRTIEEIEAEVENYIESNGCDPNTPEALSLWVKWMEATTRGIKPSRLKEPCQAERENRCVVLLCKVGDVLFVPCVTSVMETTVTSVQIYEKCVLITTKNFNKHGIANTHAFYGLDIGKTVFLTKEEAANALKGEGHE